MNRWRVSPVPEARARWAPWRVGVAGLASLLWSCAGPPQGAAPPVPPVAAAPAETAPAAPSAPLLDIAIVPIPAESALEVRMTSSLPAGNRRWGYRGRAEALADLTFSDQDGAVAFRSEPARGFPTHIILQREPRGRVSVRYRVTTEPFSVERPLWPAMDPNQARFSGELVLLLPEADPDAAVPVRLAIEPKAFAPGATVASNLGLGSVVRGQLSTAALSASTFLVGTLGFGEFVAPEGVDRAAWLGYSNFDPRQVAAEVAGFRSGARQYFGAQRSAPSTLLLVADARKPGQFDVHRRAGGVLVHAGLMQAWDGPLRITVMQQLMREWIGAELSIAPADADFPLESAWFLDGLNRSVTRALLFRYGLLTPEEFRDDVQQMLRLHVTSPLKSRPLHDLKRADPQRASAIIVARGALYAMVIDGAIRKKSGGKRSLDDVVRALYVQALAASGPLPPQAFVTAVQAELGQAALALDSGVLRGDSKIVVPVEAMGPCFVAVKRRYEVYDLGFERSTDETGVTLATNVRDPGPAARAGLHAGERVQRIRYQDGDVETEVDLEVLRGAESVRLRYRPSGGFVIGQGFDRKANTQDAECARGR